MQVKTHRLGAATYLTPDGPFAHDGLGPLAEALRAARQDGAAHIVIDLHLVPYIDSAGLELLLDSAGELREAGGSLRLANAIPICREVLAITRLDQSIPVHEDLASAARSFL